MSDLILGELSFWEFLKGRVEKVGLVRRKDWILSRIPGCGSIRRRGLFGFLNFFPEAIVFKNTVTVGSEKYHAVIRNLVTDYEEETGRKVIIYTDF